jgi:hypothetical protein
VKLAEHIKAVRSVQILLVSMPLVAKFFDHKSGLPFPPLGDDTAIWRAVALLIVLASVVGSFAIPPKMQQRATIIALFILTIVSAGGFLVCEQTYVVPIGISASPDNPEGVTAFICRGNRRPDLNPKYASLQEDELIERTGLRDRRLLHIYTSSSLRWHRQLLFWTYTLTLVFLELMIGAAAGTDAAVSASNVP